MTHRSPSLPISTPMLVLGLILLLGPAASAQASAPAPKEGDQATAAGDASAERAAEPRRADPEQTVEPVVYVPPRRGSPRAKVGGGLRGAPALPTPLALAPSHLAETVTAHPSLFWHIDALPRDGSTLLFTLIDGYSVDPVAEVRLPRPHRPGIQRIDLARLGVDLAPGVEYEWSVSIVSDPRHPARDRVSTGFIRRVAVPPGLASATAGSYAAQGLWYDALETISDAIEASPSDSGLRRQRDSLLRQAELDAAVE